MMSFLAETKEMLIFEEGWRNSPYKCTAGALTVGVGHNLDANPLSDEVVEKILEEDIDAARIEAVKIFGPHFYAYKIGRRLAIINMIFQLGASGFRKFTQTIRAIKKGKWEDAAMLAQESLWFKEQTPERASRVVEMLRTGKSVYEQ